MLRRKTRDPTDNIELGQGLALASALPMKKLTTMKIIKFLVLVVVIIALHSMYKVLFQDTSDVSDSDSKDIGVQKSIGDSEQSKHEVVVKRKGESELKEESKNSDNAGTRNGQDELVYVKEVQKGTIDENKESDTHNEGDKISEGIDKMLKVEELENDIKEKDIDIRLHQKDENDKRKSQQEIVQEGQVAGKVDSQNDFNTNILENPKQREMVAEKQQIQQEVKNQDAREESLEDKLIKEKKTANIRAMHFDINSGMIGDVPKKEKVYDEDHHSHTLFPFVTAVSQDQIDDIEQLIYTVQTFHPRENIHIYDLNLNKEQNRRMASYCGVRMHSIWHRFTKEFQKDISKFLYRPLILQDALRLWGHFTWINPGFILASSRAANFVHESEKNGIIIFGEEQPFTTYAVTHPNMYGFLQPDEALLSKLPHIRIDALMLHPNLKLDDIFLSKLFDCSNNEECISPWGAQKICDFDYSGRKYAGCHKYDESAMNILLKNWLKHDQTKVVKMGNYLRNAEPGQSGPIKQCRDQ